MIILPWTDSLIRYWHFAYIRWNDYTAVTRFLTFCVHRMEWLYCSDSIPDILCTPDGMIILPWLDSLIRYWHFLHTRWIDSLIRYWHFLHTRWNDYPVITRFLELGTGIFSASNIMVIRPYFSLLSVIFANGECHVHMNFSFKLAEFSVGPFFLLPSCK